MRWEVSAASCRDPLDHPWSRRSPWPFGGESGALRLVVEHRRDELAQDGQVPCHDLPCEIEIDAE
jgi:hypothetical protein